MRSICRPQLFVKDMIIKNDTDTSEISISTLPATRMVAPGSVYLRYDTECDAGWKEDVEQR